MSEGNEKGFKGHVHMLDLDRFFVVALDKFKCKTGFGTTFALFNILNEYLHQEGCMDEEGYQYHKRKYSVTLLEEAKLKLRQERAVEEAKPLTKEVLEEQRFLKGKERQFSMALEQWNLHPSKEWRLTWVNEAEKYKDKVANAKLILALANNLYGVGHK